MTVHLTDSSTLACDHDQGCSAFFQSPHSHSWARETRQEARRVGWEVNVQQQAPGRNRRLDFCPNHIRTHHQPEGIE